MVLQSVMSLFRVSWWFSQLVFTMAAWIEANISVHLQGQKRTSSLHIITSCHDNILYVLLFLCYINRYLIQFFFLKDHLKVTIFYKKISRKKNRKVFWVFIHNILGSQKADFIFESGPMSYLHSVFNANDWWGKYNFSSCYRVVSTD